MEWKDLLLALIALTSCMVCSAFPSPNDDAIAMANDHTSALAGFGEMVNTGTYSQSISSFNTFADGRSWSAGAAADVLGTKVAFEAGVSSAQSLGIDPIGANVASAAGTHASSAISSEKLGFSKANAESDSHSITMGNGQASSDAGASTITDTNFVLATGQASVKASIKGNSGFSVPPVIPDNQCNYGKCGNWDKSYEDKDRCHRHDRPHKPNNNFEPLVESEPVVIQEVTYYTEFVPVVFATVPQHAYINEAGRCVELYSINVNMVLDGATITQKETGVVLLSFNTVDGMLVSGDHPVFSWDATPISGTLVFADNDGAVLDEFAYIAPADPINDSAQRIPDGSTTIVANVNTTWWEENSL